MSRGRIVVVAGTRPEFLKLGPVVAALHGRAQVTVITTGQHTDLVTENPAAADFGARLFLGVPPADSWTHWVATAAVAIGHALADMAPVACVVVQGDTMSALAGARAAHAAHLPLAHVEAGLRSGSLDDPWPEEGLRREITGLADFHYAPTALAAHHLADEGVPAHRIHQTGNPIVSALHRYGGDLIAHPPARTNSLLVTLHRRELINRGHHHLCRMLDALLQFCADHPATTVRWPMHPSMRLALGDTLDTTSFPHNLWITAPLGYRDTIQALLSVRGVVTDSGGITEEATTAGTPCVVLRQHTDRPEALAARFAPDATGLATALWKLTTATPKPPSDIFGTPDAASRIASHLANLT